jgi:hypothetical protein
LRFEVARIGGGVGEIRIRITITRKIARKIKIKRRTKKGRKILQSSGQVLLFGIR